MRRRRHPFATKKKGEKANSLTKKQNKSRFISCDVVAWKREFCGWMVRGGGAGRGTHNACTILTTPQKISVKMLRRHTVRLFTTEPVPEDIIIMGRDMGGRGCAGQGMDGSGGCCQNSRRRLARERRREKNECAAAEGQARVGTRRRRTVSDVRHPCSC